MCVHAYACVSVCVSVTRVTVQNLRTEHFRGPVQAMKLANLNQPPPPRRSWLTVFPLPDWLMANWPIPRGHQNVLDTNLSSLAAVLLLPVLLRDREDALGGRGCHGRRCRHGCGEDRQKGGAVGGGAGGGRQTMQIHMWARVEARTSPNVNQLHGQ